MRYNDRETEQRIPNSPLLSSSTNKEITEVMSSTACNRSERRFLPTAVGSAVFPKACFTWPLTPLSEPWGWWPCDWPCGLETLIEQAWAISRIDVFLWTPRGELWLFWQNVLLYISTYATSGPKGNGVNLIPMPIACRCVTLLWFKRLAPKAVFNILPRWGLLSSYPFILMFRVACFCHLLIP